MVTINLRFTNIYSVMSPAMMMPNPKKVTKIKKHFVCRSGGRGPCGARFLLLRS
jgi:hypothetical protein